MDDEELIVDQEEFAALRFVHNIYGSLDISPWTIFRELLRASGSLALAFASYTSRQACQFE